MGLGIQSCKGTICQSVDTSSVVLSGQDKLQRKQAHWMNPTRMEGSGGTDRRKVEMLGQWEALFMRSQSQRITQRG